MAIEFRPYDSAEFLKSEDEVATYLDEAFRDGDPSMIAHALGVAARARGMSQLARQTGLKREGLYRSLSANGNPELDTFVRVIKEMGMQIRVEPASRTRVTGKRGKAA
jgi:probable addiction module antidote protein